MSNIDIKKIRLLLGLTQKEMADKIGVSVNTILNYENGRVIPASKTELLAYLADIAEAQTNVRGDNNVVNTGNINTGSIGGHSLNFTGSGRSRITGPSGKDSSDKVLVQRINSLEAEITRLEAIVKSKDETIAAKDDLIRVLMR